MNLQQMFKERRTCLTFISRKCPILAYSTYIRPSLCVVRSLHNFGSTCRLEMHHWLGCSKEPKDAGRGASKGISVHRSSYARYKLL